MEKEKKFIDGLFVNKPTDNMPEFIKARLSIKYDKFIVWLKDNQNESGYINIDIKESKSGNYYADLNDWKCSDKLGGVENEINTENIPF